MRFEQRGHWQNEESCLVFLGAINSEQLEEEFSLSVHWVFESEGSCCSPCVWVCATESARGAGKGLEGWLGADRCQHNLLKCMKDQEGIVP